MSIYSTLLSTWVELKAPTEYRGFSEELTERAWLQLVRSCALHTCCCPKNLEGEGDRMQMFRGIPQGQEWSSEEFQDELRQEGVGITLYNIQTGEYKWR